MNSLIRVAAFLALVTLAPWAAAADWLPVRETSLTIKAGSPLDFSAILPNAAIDDAHRLIVGEGGRMATAAKPGSAKPLFCASLAWSPASGGFPDHATADLYAKQLAMRGYNIARFHFIDASLMEGRARDFDFDPEVLDRIHYLMAALKRNGIYWMVDGLTSWRGAYGGFGDRWDFAGNLKLALYFDDGTFEHWQRLQREFLAKINPYTGVAPIHDEALALLILNNENGMEFAGILAEGRGGPAYDRMLQKPFNDWLLEKYGSTAQLARIWPDMTAREKLETASVTLPSNRYEDSPRLRDLQAFFVETERRTAERMTKVVRDLGYRGVISTYNNWATLQTALSRQGLEAVTMNTYQDWVSGYEPGSTMGQKSSFHDAASYMRYAAASRWLDKPFSISEYDHLFWSRYRYEAGLVMPAYAALQGWDILCRHGHGPIALRYGEPYPHKRAMLPYAIALDPVARASETLAAMLFRRGDVAPARNTIPFTVRGTEDLNEDIQAAEPDALTTLALISRIGLQQSQGLRIPLAVNQPRSGADAGSILDAAKEAGFLPEGNRTDPAKGIFESDTGELFLDRTAGRLTLSTLRTVAAAFERLDTPIDLGSMRIERSDGPALLAAIALDETASLAAAKRILLVFATDARNTNMRFRDAEEKVIEDFGSLPVLIRKGEAALEFVGRTGSWRLSPIGLDGTVHAPMFEARGPVRFNLSNDAPAGPTTFFLLETD